VPGGVEIQDLVDYALPLGPLGRLAHAIAVRRQLRAIFDFRRERIAVRFPFTDDARSAALGGPRRWGEPADPRGAQARRMR
jgi:hypothetical protein